MHSLTFLTTGAIACLTAATSLSASTILFDWGLQMNGSFVTGSGQPGVGSTPSLPSGVDASAFDFTSGLGTLTVDFNGPGTYSIDWYIDIEINESTTGFTNETGATNGTSGSNQSWEIDEPGFRNPDPGDIFDNTELSMLDNQIQRSPSEDLAMALGYDFMIPAVGGTATVNFYSALTAPTGDVFYLTQFDPGFGSTLDKTVYFWSDIELEVIPEPSLLIGLGALAACGFSLWRARRKSLRS